MLVETQNSRNKFEVGYEVPQVLDGMTNLRLVQYEDGSMTLEMRIRKNGPKAPRGEFTESVWVPIPIFSSTIKREESIKDCADYVKSDDHFIGYKFKERTPIAEMRFGGGGS